MNRRLELVRRCILEAMTVVAPGVFAVSATHLLLLQIVYGQNLALVVREHREVLLGLLAQLETVDPPRIGSNFRTSTRSSLALMVPM
jgi:hypothetical protein